ncbi:MAG: ATP-grasp domain-containing protein [Bdellovibrio sp.]|nr:ATP-grasp domain-containing protein [Bdellovibrio sp.]
MIKIHRVLIANRGEIAVRIIQTLREMGVASVCLMTEEEAGLPHTLYADEVISLGVGPLRDTYLNQDRIIEIARQTKSDAIHPGYGLLSENAEFAFKVEKAGLIFIGPKAVSIKAMGDKIQSKERCIRLGIPLIPGVQAEGLSDEKLLSAAKKIGPPVLIKASAGGGGKGMRIVEDNGTFAQRFIEALGEARREAKAAFGDDRVLIEKYIQNPRHIEIQVFGDQHGNYVHLFERECSIQRRYQKIIEESPSPIMTDVLRAKMTEAALKICRDINYVGAGTVEFIFSEQGEFFFLEMNTRLQVEHPVTEWVTGLDLVRWQMLVAQGEVLPLKQSEIFHRGHALEVRLCAEDPDNAFLPCIGTILKVAHQNLGPGQRLDTGYREGNGVSVSFDSLLGKLCVHALTRHLAIERMIQALKSVCFLGVKNNRDYLGRILRHPAFQAGKTYTSFVQTFAKDLLPKTLTCEEEALMLALPILASQINVVGEKNGRVADKIPDVFELIRSKLG